jgi:hypothetical protein
LDVSNCGKQLKADTPDLQPEIGFSLFAIRFEKILIDWFIDLARTNATLKSDLCTKEIMPYN